MTWATKWWKKDKKKNKKTSASSYWYEDYSSDFDYKSFYDGWGSYDEKEIKTLQRSQDLYKLNATRRAISNFVHIVTGRNIPVTYASRSNSFTDGTNVVLSADVNDNFDVGVGLALHEGSHIVLSDFVLLQVIEMAHAHYNSIRRDPSIRDLDRDDALESYIPQICKTNQSHQNIIRRIFTNALGLSKYRQIDPALIQIIHGITNWIEDRRIDAFIYKNAPGYRQYYLTMYDHYFNSKDVTKGIESDEFRTEDIDSYMFRIINFTNEKTDLNALKELRRIYRLIDLKNIDRLKTTVDCMNLSIDIIEIILDSIGRDAALPQPGGNEPQDGKDGESGQQEIEITDIDDGESDEQGGTQGGGGMSGKGKLSTNPSDKSGQSIPQGATITLSKTAAEKLKKAFDKQKNFLKNEIKKKNLSKDEQKALQNIEESGSQLVNVGSDIPEHGYYRGRGDSTKRGVDCVVVHKLTDAVIKSDQFPFSAYEGRFEKEVAEGIKFGTILGNKLKVRSESRDTVFSRLNKGKIDQRLISGLGYGAESVFYTREVDQFKKANLHISVDYSGSMGGNRLRRAITAVTAIVKAAQMARNINVQVTIRSTTNSTSKSLPYVAQLYDSRRDSFARFVKLISQIDSGNTTPEGLCFEATMKNFVQTSKDVDSYFLNFSDGEPGFEGEGFHYGGDTAAQHTNRQIKRMKEMGINVLSYFIGEGEVRDTNRSWQIFKMCYGTDAKWIDTNNMVAVAKTMNEMFLKKGGRE